MRRPSHLTRAVRCLTALLTVWCLGCSAFDELLACLIPGAGPTMVCASEGTMASGAVQAGTGRQPSAIMAAADESGTGADCDCGSCHAPAPTQLAIESPNPPVSGQPADDPGMAPTTTRAPLVPPPQRAA
jgi:hypothetical protein